MKRRKLTCSTQCICKGFELSTCMKICLPKALNYSKHEVECGIGYEDRSQTLHFKLGHKVSNKGKHLNHLRWITKNMNKYKSSQAQRSSYAFHQLPFTMYAYHGLDKI